MGERDGDGGPITWLLIVLWVGYTLAGSVYVGRMYLRLFQAHMHGMRISAVGLRHAGRRLFGFLTGHAFWVFAMALVFQKGAATALFAAVLFLIVCAVNYHGLSVGINRLARQEGIQQGAKAPDCRR
jgi:hypothetical protein